MKRRKPLPERGHDLVRLVDGKRRLGDVGDALRIGHGKVRDVLDALDEHRSLRRLADRSLDLLVARVADEDDRVALGRISPCLRVDLRHERTRGVDRLEVPLRRADPHGRRDAVGGEDDQRALRYLLLAVDEDGAALLEIAHDMRVVDDLLTHVDGRSILLERAFDRLDGSLDACAVAARRRQQYPLHHGLTVARSRRAAALPNRVLTVERARRSGGRRGGPSQLLTGGLNGQVPPAVRYRPVAGTLTGAREDLNRPTGPSFQRARASAANAAAAWRRSIILLAQ